MPVALVAIVERAMARDLTDRYPSVLELASDVRALLDRRAVKAYRTGTLVETRLWMRRNKPSTPASASLVEAPPPSATATSGTTRGRIPAAGANTPWYVSRQIGDRGGEGGHLGNLGNAYFRLGEPRQLRVFRP